MGNPTQRDLRAGLLGAGLVLALIGLALGVAPWVAREVVERRRGGSAVAEQRDPASVHAYLDAALNAEGLQRRSSTELAGGRQSEVWQAPPGTEMEDLMVRLSERAREAGVEQHGQVRDELDAQLRTWAGSIAVDEVLILPSLPPDSPPPAAPNRRIRPLLAIVIAGLGDVASAELVSTPVPLTIAVRPMKPASLRVARDAALAWQEVLADLRGSELAAAEARAALPFCTGLLLDETSTGPLDGLEMDTVLVAPGGAAKVRGPALLVQGAWLARDRGVEDLLARLSHLLARRGHSTLVIEHDAPALPELLRWAQEVGASRYRLVQASEISRPIELIGGREELVRP